MISNSPEQNVEEILQERVNRTKWMTSANWNIGSL